MDDFFTVYQNSDHVLTPISLVDDNGLPLDLTSATEIKAIFLTHDSNAPLLTRLLSTNGVTILNAPGGRISVKLTAANTALLKLQDRGNFEIEVDLPATGINVQGQVAKLTVLPRLGS